MVKYFMIFVVKHFMIFVVKYFMIFVVKYFIIFVNDTEITKIFATKIPYSTLKYRA